jgi:hypothetical protein
VHGVLDVCERERLPIMFRLIIENMYGSVFGEMYDTYEDGLHALRELRREGIRAFLIRS